MEVLKPAEVEKQSVPEQGQKSEITEQTFNGISLSVLENLNYLGMMDRMFDAEVIDKVQTITDYLDGRDIFEFDTQIGNPYMLSKIDNMYSYIKLEQQEHDLMNKEQLIRQQKEKYATI